MSEFLALEQIVDDDPQDAGTLPSVWIPNATV